MRVLFVCKHNAGRSQISEAFFNHFTIKHTATSAGTHPPPEPLPEFVLRCMNEKGIDMSKHSRKPLTQELFNQADKVIMLTSKEDWPAYALTSSKVEYWEVEGGKGQSYEFICLMRDKLELLILDLIKRLP